MSWRIIQSALGWRRRVAFAYSSKTSRLSAASVPGSDDESASAKPEEMA